MTTLWRVTVTMLRRLLLLGIVLALFAIFIEAQQRSQSSRSRKASPTHNKSRRKPAKPPVTSFASDSGGPELIVRLLDVGQGDATYIRNGSSKVIIDGGPDSVAFGRS